ncbi:helix-turn-helix transcriptional regulator [Streptomyces sp. CHA1]|uniref:winged helix-turn-helix transcriptional regulator n=1 Tax=Streptomyces TaxID=1883 RepID=UPI001397FEC0|nr:MULTISPECIES: helix-turn-helix domain-containing protein [unclassified Streptomyces]MBP3076731.1 HxlR family transcriptional regulator [Streptomyces sp. 604F]MBT3159210.1 helix-turn-helix transcriptional regulator [Streptomyces sp. G11C]MCO6699980.1 helix-turn-helix transcriptional regulator [Streptomyces sp. CHB9.2]MCO6706100.1 helix-turn-helix transcriptional regulator [Streptomyces sp. CHA3]MCO6711863.1 helix-turn-helix transcriptional regulator [Streptomyces sp. CHB19.2]
MTESSARTTPEESGPLGPSGAPDAFDVFDVFARSCPSRTTLEHVTGRWGGLTLGALHEDTLRFNQLRRRVDGVSEKMLSQTLHALERDGLVVRDARPGNPPHVEYRLTPLGAEVSARLLGLITLLENRMPEVLAARQAYDGRGGK